MISLLLNVLQFFFVRSENAFVSDQRWKSCCTMSDGKCSKTTGNICGYESLHHCTYVLGTYYRRIRDWRNNAGYTRKPLGWWSAYEKKIESQQTIKGTSSRLCDRNWKAERCMLWKCWHKSMYESMYSSTALVCIVDLVDLICVGWHVTYTEELLL